LTIIDEKINLKNPIKKSHLQHTTSEDWIIQPNYNFNLKHGWQVYRQVVDL